MNAHAEMNEYRITDKQAKLFGCVAVLYGGNSAEREISIKSGMGVLAALQQAGVNAIGVDINNNLPEIIAHWQFDRAFIALHGRGGEDGAVQGLLQSLNIPFTGSGVLASSLAMDKTKAKLIWESVGILTPPFVELSLAAHPDYTTWSLQQWEAICQDLSFPLCVKPVNEGSSLGVSKIDNIAALPGAVKTAFALDAQVLVEHWIDGPEFTVGLLGDQPLPVIGLRTKNTFYDYEAKYQSGDTEYLLPSGLSAEQEEHLQVMSMNAFDILGCTGWGRTDIMQDTTGEFWLLEVNTVPGMTTHSLVPKAAAAAGISFPELVVRILTSSLDQIECAAF